MSRGRGRDYIRKIEYALYNVGRMKRGQNVGLDRAEKWQEVIEKAYARTDEVTCRIARRRYRGEDYRRISVEESISVNVLYRRLRNFLELVCRLSIQSGLIKI